LSDVSAKKRIRELLPIFVMQGKIMKFVKKKPKIIA